MSAEDRIRNLGILLPEVPAPIAAYVPAVLTEDLVFVSGQLPRVDGAVQYPGKVGAEVSLEEGRQAARTAAVGALAALKSVIGSLDQVERIVNVTGYVQSTPDFYAQPQVVDGASELMLEVFQDAGRHSRAAVGVASLPLNAPVEISLVARIKR